jgi:hypothetical protein
VPDGELGWWKISWVVGPCSVIGYVNKGIVLPKIKNLTI